MGGLACTYIKCSTHKMAERDLTKKDLFPRESLEEYGKAPAKLSRKTFWDDARKERKQMLRQLEEGLTDPALSSLYLNVAIEPALVVAS